MAHYTIAIDKIVVSDGQREESNGRLRIEISSSLPASDTNNNIKETCIRNVACFEILEEGIKSIKVSPVISDAFSVEYIKACEPDPFKTASVQVIHKRHGKLSESNENVSLIQSRQIPVAEGPLPSPSTCEVSCPSVPKEDWNNNLIPFITQEDIVNFTRFTFKLFPASSPAHISEAKINEEIEILEEPPKEIINGSSDDLEKVKHIFKNEESKPTTELTASEKIVLNLEQEREMPDENQITHIKNSWVESGLESTSISFHSVFDDAVSIIIEIHNQTHKSIQALHRIADQASLEINNNPSPRGNSKLKDFKDIAQTRINYGKISHLQTYQNMHKTPPQHRISTVRRFIQDMIRQRLLSLGVQQLDCNEIIDLWQSKQYQTAWHSQWPDEDFHPAQGIIDSFISPNLSKPNSSLFRLTPSGHICRSIFSTFAHQVETLKGIINNATCTLIHTSVHLLLPEIKLLKSRQLETNSNPHFIHKWVKLLLLAAKELKPAAPQDVTLMVNRELWILKTLAKKLHTATKKVHHKIEKLSDFSEIIFRKSLYRLHPKSLAKLNACTLTLRRKLSPNVIHYDADQLRKISVNPEYLLKEHFFFSETESGHLLIKNDLDSFWKQFLDLEFNERRIIFLALAEDLQINLRTSLNAIQHLQEIYTSGYPASIKNILKEVVEELKFTSKRDDLTDLRILNPLSNLTKNDILISTVLIKTSLVTHVTSLHELLTRLRFVSEEMDEIVKNFHQSLKVASFNPTILSKELKKRDKKRNISLGVTDRNQKDGRSVQFHLTNLNGYQKGFEAGIEHSNAQLVIPLRHLDFENISKILNDS